MESEECTMWKVKYPIAYCGDKQNVFEYTYKINEFESYKEAKDFADSIIKEKPYYKNLVFVYQD
jgi:hypothetical protein